MARFEESNSRVLDCVVPRLLVLPPLQSLPIEPLIVPSVFDGVVTASLRVNEIETRQ